VTSEYRSAQIADIPPLPNDLVEADWKPVRHHLGITAFGTNAYVARAEGQLVIEEHSEGSEGHEELYVVAAGRATFTVAGEEIDAPAGTLVAVTDPAIVRGAVAREPGTTVFVVGAPAGAPFAPRNWERTRIGE
jgi:hypothetical protein